MYGWWSTWRSDQLIESSNRGKKMQPQKNYGHFRGRSQLGRFCSSHFLTSECSLVTTTPWGVSTDGSSQAPSSDLGPTIHENQNEWQIPSLKSEVVILGGSNLGMESKIETNWSSVECYSFPGAKLAHLKKMFVASEETPHTTPEHLIIAESGAKNYKRPPSTRV